MRDCQRDLNGFLLTGPFTSLYRPAGLGMGTVPRLFSRRFPRDSQKESRFSATIGQTPPPGHQGKFLHGGLARKRYLFIHCRRAPGNVRAIRANRCLALRNGQQIYKGASRRCFSMGQRSGPSVKMLLLQSRLQLGHVLQVC